MKRASRHQEIPSTLMHHLRELQFRVLIILASLAAGGGVTYLFYNQIFAIIRQPVNGPLYYTTPAGSFSFILKICLIGAIALSIPTLLYNLIMFVRPAFSQAITKKRVWFTAMASVVLAACGTLFGYFVVLPDSLKFFNGFQLSGLHSLITADSYLQLVTNIILTFVIMFQLPLLVSFIDIVKPLKPRQLLKMEKWVILGSLIISLLAPFTYDLTVSLLLAVPVIALYNISIIIVVMQHSAQARQLSKVRNATIYQQTTLPAPVRTVVAAAMDGQPEQVIIHQPSIAVLKQQTAQPKRVRKTMDFIRPGNPVTQTSLPVKKQSIRPVVTPAKVISDVIRIAPA